MPGHSGSLDGLDVAPTDIELNALAEQVAGRLKAADLMLVCAESCTGGWVAKVCTDLAGSSAWFSHGFVTYSNGAKQRLVGVSEDTLSAFGAVSQQTAQAMAWGARAGEAQQVSVAITGVAGPSGGSADKPVGTVWFAWSLPDHPVMSEQAVFSGDRDAVRRHSVGYALSGVIRRLD